jgi:serine/threonine protein kinase
MILSGMVDDAAAHTSEAGSPPALGKYTPFARLGHGGMAEVFLAVARGPVGFNKLAVVKRLRNADDTASLEMFLDEARLSARLSHPNIVNTYEVGEAGGRYFIAMEYLEGQPLHVMLAKLTTREAPLDETLSAFIAIQALKALHYAHDLGDYDGTPLNVVHRDVSPHNLFITYQGEVKLLDFGIAKAALNYSHTKTGVLKGKVRYMAPEQVGDKNIDRRADVFALGVVFWEMLAGRPLYPGRADVASLLVRITGDDPPLLRTVREDVSPQLEMIVAKALRRDLGARYATAAEMRADLERVLRGRQDGADATLARMLNERFADTRDAVRARIKTFLGETSPSSGSTPASSLTRAADLLPSLFGDAGMSGVSSSGGVWPTGNSSNPLLAPPLLPAFSGFPQSPARRWPWVLAVAAALGAIGGFAMLAARAPRPAPVEPVALPAVVAAAAPTTTPVHVETSPSGALVEWNGQPLARAPADIQLPPGSQTLKVSFDGYEPEAVTVDVKLEEPATRRVVLRARTQPPPAVVTPPPAHRAYRRPPAPPPRTPQPQTSARPKIRIVDGSSPHSKIRVVDDDAP